MKPTDPDWTRGRVVALAEAEQIARRRVRRGRYAGKRVTLDCPSYGQPPG